MAEEAERSAANKREQERLKSMSMTHVEKTVASIKLCMAERGYIVVGIKPGYGEPYRVGQILDTCCGVKMDQPFAVLGPTDYADWAAQIKLIADKLFPMTTAPNGDSYWRVTTD